VSRGNGEGWASRDRLQRLWALIADRVSSLTKPGAGAVGAVSMTIDTRLRFTSKSWVFRRGALGAFFAAPLVLLTSRLPLPTSSPAPPPHRLICPLPVCKVGSPQLAHTAEATAALKALGALAHEQCSMYYKR